MLFNPIMFGIWGRGNLTQTFFLKYDQSQNILDFLSYRSIRNLQKKDENAHRYAVSGDKDKKRDREKKEI